LAGSGKIQRVEDDQPGGSLAELGLQLGQVAPVAELRDPEAQPQPRLDRELVEVHALVGADGAQPPHDRALPTFPEEHQHPAWNGAGEAAEPGVPGGDAYGQVERGPGLAGLVLCGQHPVGVGGPQALDQPGGWAGGVDPGDDLGQVLDHQPPV